jgi:hypothetical protein
MTNFDAIAKGVTDSWDFWLSQHDVSVPDTIEVAVRGAVQVWLEANTPALTAAIAKAVADRWEGENR